MSRPLALLSNDDGFRAEGLQTLARVFAEVMDVVVCAPEIEQSASSHALSLHRPLRLTEQRGCVSPVFTVDGTPADCVYVALYSEVRVLPRRPDIVVSGLNHGLNLGDDVFYSGTVAAAREGALKGIPSIAASAAPDASFEAAARVTRRIAEVVVSSRAPRPLLLNVNFPSGEQWALRATRLGRRVYQDSVEYRRDPRGREYLWIGGPGVEHGPAPGSDTEAFDAGIVGVTPLILDLWGRDRQSDAESIVDAVTLSTAQPAPT